MEKCRIGVIGLGARGISLLKDVILLMEDVEIQAVCDVYEDRAEDARRLSEEAGHKQVLATTDYHDVLAIDTIDAVVICSAWESHVDIACDAMKAGKYVGVEVGGVYDISQCWRLVRTSEKTGMPCMMLENCCYGKYELMVLNMVRQGVFGEIVHCTGGYCHELLEEVAKGKENRHYRLRNYLHRNCDNYNTHALGPISKVLNINRGNRMLSLTSTASKSAGLPAYIRKNPENFDAGLRDAAFCQGDVVTTNIRCANGETITHTFSTTLPRPYSREFAVFGTKGMYQEQNNSVFLTDEPHAKADDWSKFWGNAEEYHKCYGHPLWKTAEEEGIKGGHGGMDWLVFRAFFESVMKGVQTPIDVYDTATWMCIAALSEQSVVLGGAPVFIPDFTCGAWMSPRPYEKGPYCLEEIDEES